MQSAAMQYVGHVFQTRAASEAEIEGEASASETTEI